VKQEIKYHFLPLLGIFFLVSIVWILNKVTAISFISLFLGLFVGSFLLDSDHLIYWFFLHPDSDEGQQAKRFLTDKKYKNLLKLLENTHKNHISLIFHHYFFQAVLVLITFFVFTSTPSVFPKAILMALNVHLLVDEIIDFKTDKKHLQEWLFAREEKQLSLNSLKYYIGVFAFVTSIYLLILINSKL
jgi:hypothetical protein